jgi:hypothetical protein
MLRTILIAALAVLCGCVAQPKGVFHEAKSGLRVDSNPALLARFQQSRVICDGEAAQAALVSTEKDRYTHSLNVNLVYDACLAKAGYLRR